MLSKLVFSSLGYIFGLSFLTIVHAHSAMAFDETNREISRIFVSHYLNQKNHAAAIHVLENHLKTDQGDADAWNLLGMIYLETKELKKSISAFKQAVTLVRTSGIYFYNYADALIRSGDPSGARTALIHAEKDPTVSPQARQALGALITGQPLPELSPQYPGVLKAQIILGTGFDSNVLLLNSIVATASATRTSSIAMTAINQVDYQKNIFHGNLNGTGIVGFNFYPSSDANQYNALMLGAGADWGRSSMKVLGQPFTMGDQLNINFLNNRGFGLYEIDNTLRAKSTWRLSPSRELSFMVPLRYQKFPQPTGTDPALDRSGVAISPQATYVRPFFKGVLSVGLMIEHLFASGQDYISNTISLPIYWSKSGLPWGLTGGGGLTSTLVSFPKSTGGRTDRNFLFSISVGRPFERKLFGMMVADYTVNSSSLTTTSYNKFSLMLKVAYAWF